MTSVGMLWKVVYFMKIVLDGFWSYGLPPLDYCHMCDLFCTSFYISGNFLLIALYSVCNSKSLGSIISLESNYMV